MLTDIAGRVRNTKLPPSHALLPLFEAVVNSIYACDQRQNQTEARIEIILLRGAGTTPLIEGIDNSPIESFEVIDNGEGFNEKNYQSFKTADSRHKAHVGGKGIGRFLWLKAFDRAEIASAYQETHKSQWKRRTLTLALTEEGIENHKLEVLDDADKPSFETRVKLIGIHAPYADRLPKSIDAIGDRIIEHCLQHFVLGLHPRIRITDAVNSLSLST